MKRFNFIMAVFGLLLLTAVSDPRDSLDEYQTELPTPPECPESFEVFEAGSCEPKTFEASTTTDWTLSDEATEWQPPDFDLPAHWDWESFGAAFIVICVGFLLAFVIILALRIYKKRRKIDVGDTDGLDSNFVTTLRNEAGDESHTRHAQLSNFDAAIHALLLEVIEHVFWRKPELNQPSTTSREITRAYQGQTIHGDLDALILIVELIRFARHASTSEDYDRAVEHHRALMNELGASND